MGIACYWLEPTRQARLSLRRYSSGNGCSIVPRSYHNAQTPLFDVAERFEFSETYGHKLYSHDGPSRAADVPLEYRWPTHCACGYEFTESDARQVFSESLYRRADTGEILTQREFGPGAMWNLEYLNDNTFMRGDDGLSISVICPNGREWFIDGGCSNCTKPEDKVHKCWCRHGTPPVLTVDKDCNSCSAGAGSIQAGDWHGWLKSRHTHRSMTRSEALKKASKKAWAAPRSRKQLDALSSGRKKAQAAPHTEKQHEASRRNARIAADKNRRPPNTSGFKVCGHCKVEQPLSEFSRSKNTSSWCLDCCSKNAKKWRQLNIEHARAFDIKRSGRNKTLKSREWQRFYRWLTKYGLRPEDYHFMFESQGGRCAICGTAPSGGEFLHVDHDHGTLEIRGLLCRACNHGLGAFKDNPHRLLNAAGYLENNFSSNVEFQDQVRSAPTKLDDGRSGARKKS